MFDTQVFNFCFHFLAYRVGKKDVRGKDVIAVLGTALFVAQSTDTVSRLPEHF